MVKNAASITTLFPCWYPVADEIKLTIYPSQNVNIPNNTILEGKVLPPLQQKIYVWIPIVNPIHTHSSHWFWSWNMKYVWLSMDRAVINTVMINWTKFITQYHT